MLKNFIACLFGYHEFFTIQEFGSGYHRIGCRHCDKTWLADGEDGPMIEWDDGIADLINMQGHIVRGYK